MVLCQLNLTDRENLVRTLWFRVYMWLKCLAALHERHHLQGVMAAARGLFELTVDLTLIQRDSTATPVERFLAFEEYQRWRATQRARDYCKTHPADTGVDYLRTFAARFPEGPEQTVQMEALRKKHWGTDGTGRPRKPETWSGKSIANNCLDAGFEREHVEMNALLCWSIHSGITGFINLTEDDFETNAALSYLFALRMVLRAIDIVAAEFKLTGAIPEFREKMKWVESIPGRFLTHINQRGGKATENSSPS